MTIVGIHNAVLDGLMRPLPHRTNGALGSPAAPERAPRDVPRVHANREEWGRTQRSRDHTPVERRFTGEDLLTATSTSSPTAG